MLDKFEGKIKEFVNSYEQLSPEEQEQLLGVLLGVKQQNYEESIKGNEKLVLEYLKKKCIEKENSKINRNEGTIVKLKFGEQFPTDLFVSHTGNINEIILSGYKGIMYSTKEVGLLLGAIKKYMKDFGVEIDGSFDNYENVLKNRGKDREQTKSCEAGKILKNIAGLNKIYILSNSDEDGNEIVFDCSNDNCCFRRQRKDGVFPSGLLCKVSEEVK